MIPEGAQVDALEAKARYVAGFCKSLAPLKPFAGELIAGRVCGIVEVQ